MKKMPEVTLVDENTHVLITIGRQKLTLTLSEAKAFGQSVINTAEMPSQLAHIDNVFKSWTGDDGGTC